MSIRVKICGLTREEDVAKACRAGADFLGFIVYPHSKRHIEPVRARQLIELARQEKPTVLAVVVTVDGPLEWLAELWHYAKPDYLQLHGSERPEIVARLRNSGVRVIKAVRVGPTAITPHWKSYSPDYYLCDTLDPKQAGGTGQSWNPNWLPQDFPTARSFIAGGLTPENVEMYVRVLRPFAVDVSSGVEIAPGIKDEQKIERLMAAVRQTLTE